MKLIAVTVLAAVLLSGCMANMTPEQRAKVQARMDEAPRGSASSIVAVPED